MKKLNLILLTLLCALSVKAQVVSEKDFPVVEKIASGNTSYRTIVSDFKQIQHLEMMDEDINSEGNFFYQKPDKLAMRYTDPAGDLMMINDDRFVMVAGGKKRETSGKSNQKMQGMKAILSACLQGNILQMGAERVALEETGKYYVLTCIIDRKANKSNIDHVVVSYDKSDLSLAVLQTVERDGSSTTYELTNKRFNTAIAPEMFEK